MTTVAIVEDHEIMRQTVREMIDSSPDCRCVCACASAEEALREIPRHRPDVALMDIQLSGASGITCTAQLRGLLPNVLIIMLTVYRDYSLIFQALKAGACGYLLKSAGREDILSAIEEVRSGGAPMTGEIARMVVDAFRKAPAEGASSIESLSDREQEVLGMLSAGLVPKEIAERLNLSYQTVRHHLKRTYFKLHVNSRNEAVKKYLNLEI